jgi:two-component system OmpR family sensor kinase
MSRKRGIRTRLLLASAAAVALALAVLVAGFNLVLRHELNTAATDRARTRATAELSAISVSGSVLQVSEMPDAATVDVPVWIFSGGRSVEAPRAGRQLDAAAAALTTGDIHSSDVQDTRLYAVPVVSHGRRLGTVVAAVSLAAYQDTARTALIGSLLLSAALLVVSILAARWMLERALLPVSEMTSAAAIWSEHDLDRRFAAGEPTDEIGQLASTLDGLLDRIADALRREQRLTAEISHELRTPLARIVAETGLALRRQRGAAEYRDALETVQRNAEQLTRIVDTLLDAARIEAGQRRGTADAIQAAHEAALACQPLAARHGLDLRVDGSGGRIAVDRELAVRILLPVLENACRHGREHASIDVVRNGPVMLYDISDDGAGVPEGDRDSIFEPGARGSGTAEPYGDGAGLGLALARRMARAAGGDITVEAGDVGHFRVRLPAVGLDHQTGAPTSEFSPG